MQEKSHSAGIDVASMPLDEAMALFDNMFDAQKAGEATRLAKASSDTSAWIMVYVAASSIASSLLGVHGMALTFVQASLIVLNVYLFIGWWKSVKLSRAAYVCTSEALSGAAQRYPRALKDVEGT